MTESLRYLKGVGPKKEEVFFKLGIKTIADLLHYFPFRYEDRSVFKKIKELYASPALPAERVLIKGKVTAVHLKKIPYFVKTSRVRDIFRIALADETGVVECVWFNQGFLAGSIKQGDELAVYGKPQRENIKLKFISPEYERIGAQESSLNIGRIVSIYRLPEAFTQKFIRKTIAAALEVAPSETPEAIPFYIRKERNLPNIRASLKEIHFPTSFDSAELARERFIFEELFFSQVSVYLRKARKRQQKSAAMSVRETLIGEIKADLPFELTASQSDALDQITEDMSKPWPMHRLLQGDVGCGKTVVSAFACAVCLDNGFQVAVMVPTEVLAYQHQQSLASSLRSVRTPFDRPARIEVLTSALPKKDMKKIYQALREGAIDIIVGTHALIQEALEFKALGLVVIDEQHKFGVAQRALLPKKGALSPHCLVMSATPIPRTLALSLYGDLDLTMIKELPVGRKIPQTSWVRDAQREEVYNFLHTQLSQGRQAYVVYPVIEENEDEDLQSLEEMAQSLGRRFSRYKVGMFHGRMPSKEKIRVIEQFRSKAVDILVSTTVIEVGVNVENASVMIVENPERFGLAQLHQLRGRIQRSEYQPFFILISKPDLSDLAQKRLEVICHTSDGFAIAEEDLLLRGPGDFFGELQHGLPPLKIANPLRDLQVLQVARTYAYKVIKRDPALDEPRHRCIRSALGNWFDDMHGN